MYNNFCFLRAYLFLLEHLLSEADIPASGSSSVEWGDHCRTQKRSKVKSGATIPTSSEQLHILPCRSLTADGMQNFPDQGGPYK